MRWQKWKRGRGAGLVRPGGPGAAAAATLAPLPAPLPSPLPPLPASEPHDADSASERVEGRERGALVSPASHYLFSEILRDHFYLLEKIRF